MPRPRSVVPAYRLHRQSGQAVVDVRDETGKRRSVCLGRFGSPESQAEYARVLQTIQANGGTLPGRTSARGPDLTLAELVERFVRERLDPEYLDEAGRPTGEGKRFRWCLAPLVRLYGAIPAAEFGPVHLEAHRKAAESGSWLTPEERVDRAKKGLPTDWSRRNINRATVRLRTMTKWAVAKLLVPADTLLRLAAVAPLRPGKGIRERLPVLPIAPEVVEATARHMPPVAADLVRVLLLCVARCGEICAMRGVDLDRSGPVWTFTPETHKNQWRGKNRVIAFGPRAQLILRRHLPADENDYVFSPACQAEQIACEKREARRTPVQPSQVCRKNPDAVRKPGPRFTPAAVNIAIRRACGKAGVEMWHVHRLRHTAAQMFAREAGLEGARAALGHASPSLTALYASIDLRTASDVASRVG